jgi:hypothetical protein
MSSNTPEMPEVESDFQKLLAEDKADKARQDEALKKQRGNASRNKKIGFGAVGGFTVLLLATIIVYDPFTGALRFGDGVDQTGSKPPAVAQTVQQPKWYQESTNEFPVELDAWQKKTLTDENAKEIYPAIEMYYNGSILESYALTLPSESTGYTSDPAQELLEDGTLNPMFSYWTKELYVRETGAMLERLINPTFGNWVEDSSNGRLTDGTYKTLGNLFSKQWLDSHPNATDLPLFVNSSKTDINYLPAGEKRWVGKIANIDSELNYDRSIRNYRVSLVADIVYTSWTQDQEKVTENAQIRLTLVPNQNEYSNGSANHIVIDESQIEVKS